MITREQAERAFHERYDHSDELRRPEIRNLEMVEISTQNNYDLNFETDLGQCETEDRGWKCTFEKRSKQLFLGEWLGTYDEWRKDICYIVEVKPGPYAIG